MVGGRRIERTASRRSSKDLKRDAECNAVRCTSPSLATHQTVLDQKPDSARIVDQVASPETPRILGQTVEPFQGLPAASTGAHELPSGPRISNVPPMPSITNCGIRRRSSTASRSCLGTPKRDENHSYLLSDQLITKQRQLIVGQVYFAIKDKRTGLQGPWPIASRWS